MTIPTTRGRTGSRRNFTFTGDQHGKISFMDRRRFANGQDVQIQFKRRSETFCARLDSVSPETVAIINQIRDGTIQPNQRARLVLREIDGHPVLRTSLPVTIKEDGSSIIIHFPSKRPKAA